MSQTLKRSVAVLVVGLTLTLSMSAGGQTSRSGSPKASSEQPAPIRVTMEELHARGGVPRGWKFLIPPGNAAEGRKVFVSLECFACHEVKNEDFPKDSKTPKGPGPALTGMGAHHPAEYFAESILNPNRVIVMGPGYTGPDNLSKMPSYAETMTLKQLIDVVAYLKSLTEGDMWHGGHHMGGSSKEAPVKMK